MNNADPPLEEFRRSTAAVMRAIAAREELNVSFRSGAAASDSSTIYLPPPPGYMPAAQVSRMRGEADAIALRLRYHDEQCHARHRPDGPLARAVFDAVEQVRVESIGARDMPGVALNLAAVQEEKYRRVDLSRMGNSKDAATPQIIAILVREAFTREPLPSAVMHVVESWRDRCKTRAPDAFRVLASLLDDQQAFAEQLKTFITDLGLMDDCVDASVDNDSGEDEDQNQVNGDNFGSGPGQMDTNTAQALQSGQVQTNDFVENSQDLSSVQATPGSEGQDLYRTPMQELPTDTGNGQSRRHHYQPYTVQFDEIVPAESLAERDELSSLRHKLDQQLTGLHGIVTRLANRLQRRLMVQQVRAWEFNVEDGLLDAARLARVVVNPMHALSYKREMDTEFRDTVVGILVDNSASMRGRPITIAAMCTDILARTLERCGVKVEITGFTTCGNSGGQSRAKWLAEGSPANPGRLSDLRHIIYKSADVPWRRARLNLGLMLHEDLLKDNIDGEALLWAHSRLLNRPQERRILMVISDGAPIDHSTLSVNPGSYLERHLREAIDWIEKRSPVELVAIGIGHDVTRYYRRAVTIFDAERLGETMIGQLTALFDDTSVSGPTKKRHSEVIDKTRGKGPLPVVARSRRRTLSGRGAWSTELSNRPMQP